MIQFDKRAIRTLGIDTPIIQAPMAGGTTTPELVAAVSNAGGLGSIGAGYLSAEAIEETVAATRALTDKPFALNLFVPSEPAVDQDRIEQSNVRLDSFRQALAIDRPDPPVRFAPDFEAQFDAALAARVSVFSFTFGALTPEQVSRLKGVGSTVIGTATTVAEARALEAIDVDMIVAQGSEAGGHRGTFLHDWQDALIGTMALVPQVVDAVSIPVIASGGIMEGRGVAAAFMLGACAVQMGSAFLVCQESGANRTHQQALLEADAAHTQVTPVFSGKAARGIRNRFIDEMSMLGDRIPDYPIQNAWTKDVRAAAGAKGRAEFMSLWAGQAATLARRTTAAQLIADIRSHLDSF